MMTLANSDLRQALDSCEDIRALPPHIEVVDPQPRHATRCLPVALGLRVFVGGDFVRWLLDHRLLQPRSELGGSLVLYFSEPDWVIDPVQLDGHEGWLEWKHAAVGLDDRIVVSKWGPWLLLRHPVDEVPASYGDVVRAYEHPGSTAAMEYFRAFCEAIG